MRDKDKSALREMFQYPSLVKKPLDQCKIAIQDNSSHGLVKMDHSGDNCRCPYDVYLCFSQKEMIGL